MPITSASKSKDEEIINGKPVELGPSEYVQATLAANQQHRLKLENHSSETVKYEITLNGNKDKEGSIKPNEVIPDIQLQPGKVVIRSTSDRGSLLVTLDSFSK